ncbi:MAG TPA: hypothetical protein VFV49_02460 [Thermoanaerobaculia bacterium]|nr:hypothetical protein [Thermoanaerobaculia bacterium]
MDNFAEAIVALNDMKAEGIVSDYAIGGAMALIFWSEPTATFDLDVFVSLKQDGILVSLDRIYAWSRARGYPEEAEHIVISGVPVQIIPTPNQLASEAVSAAADLVYDGQPIRVIRPEYLIAMYLEETARTRKRLERVATLLDEGNLDSALLNDLLGRYNLRLPRHEDNANT